MEASYGRTAKDDFTFHFTRHLYAYAKSGVPGSVMMKITGRCSADIKGCCSQDGRLSKKY